VPPRLTIMTTMGKKLMFSLVAFATLAVAAPAFADGKGDHDKLQFPVPAATKEPTRNPRLGRQQPTKPNLSYPLQAKGVSNKKARSSSRTPKVLFTLADVLRFCNPDGSSFLAMLPGVA